MHTYQGKEKDSSPASPEAAQPGKKGRVTPDVTRIPAWAYTLPNPPFLALGKPDKAQTASKLSQSGDTYEQKADQVAKQVMRTANPETPVSEGEDEAKNSLMREQGVEPRANASADISSVPPTVQAVLNNGGGQPLDTTTRAFMDSRFVHDFSKVRVHSGTQAEKSAASVHALAYTVGRDIVFGTGQYAPETTEGRRLLAHELTHVVQQEKANGSSLTGNAISQPAEHEAEQVAQTIVRGGHAPQVFSISRGVQRDDGGAKAPEYGVLVAEGPSSSQKKGEKPSGAAKSAGSDQQIKELMKELKKFFLKEFSNFTLKETQEKMQEFAVVPDKDMKETEIKDAKSEGEYQLKQTQKYNPQMLLYLLKNFYYPDPVPYKEINETTQFKPKDKEYLIRNIILGDILDTHRGEKVTIAFTSSHENKIYFSESRVNAAAFASDIDKVAGTIAHEMAHGFSSPNWYILTRVMLLGKDGGILDEGMVADRIAHPVARDWALDRKEGTKIPNTGYTDDPKFKKHADDFISQVGEQAALEAYFGGWIEWENDVKPEDSLIIGKKNVEAFDQYQKKGKKGSKNFTTWKWPWP
ncbi:MAG TPA: DUF4157 domain-containing protein [Ktedonobacteraceae bacterium]